MKKMGLLIGVSFGAAVISPARAVELPYLPNGGILPIYVATPFWSGAYIGGHVGAGWENAVWKNPFDGLADHAEPVGFLGGGQIGYNFQVYSWMLGIDGELMGTSLGDTRADAASFTYGIRTYWAATIAGRIGYDFVGRLLYVKGGVAFANSRETVTDSNSDSATGATTTRTGWTIGGGVEFLLYENWSARVEYNYLDFGLQNISLTLPRFGAVTAGSTVTIQTLTAGINYRF